MFSIIASKQKYRLKTKYTSTSSHSSNILLKTNERSTHYIIIDSYHLKQKFYFQNINYNAVSTNQHIQLQALLKTFLTITVK